VRVSATEAARILRDEIRVAKGEADRLVEGFNRKGGGMGLDEFTSLFLSTQTRLHLLSEKYSRI
jgi:hypothetical protein